MHRWFRYWHPGTSPRKQRVGVAVTKAPQQGEQRLADRLLVVGRQVREVGHVGMLCAPVNLWPKYRVVAAGGFEMSPLLMVYFWVATPFAGFGLLKLQARLEQWAYDRHAED